MVVQKRLQKAFGIGALVLTLGLGAMGCKGKIAETKVESERIELKVSEYTQSAYGNSSSQIVYNGMNTEKTFSLSYPFSHSAVNTYYPSDAKEINFYGKKYKVVEVTPKHIVLDYLGRESGK